MDGEQLDFNWTNDYGEGAAVQLERQDGKSWEDLLIPCTICSESDSLALVALYNATDGPNWNITWDLNEPVENWYGVKLNDDCCVSEIDMGSSNELMNLGFSNNNLVGTIPDEIGDLTNLNVLDLSSNFLTGEVISKITSLINLETLNLFNNSFDGSVPDEISDLTNLTFLDLGLNSFTGEVFPKIINLVSLETILLTSNLFTGTISSDIENLQELEVISFSDNAIEGEIPSTVGNLSNLRIFFGSINNLVGELPIEFGQLSNLEQISAWGNQFSGTIPAEFGNISNLSFLNLNRNNLGGEIPESLGQITQLTRLGLAFNQLEGSIPVGFELLSGAILNDNNLSGFIPESFASFVQIDEIDLSNNNFIGNIPGRFFDDSPFQNLYFANNDFSGCIDNIANLCTKEFNAEIDSFVVGDSTYFTFFRFGYNFEGNPKLAWEGAIQNACEGQDQIGAPCDDGDPNTSDTGIDGNCNCMPLVSTKDIKELNSITISPNPLSSGEMMNITLDLSNTIDATVKLLDLNGRTITSKSLGLISGTKTYSLSIDNLTSGLYFVQVASANGIVTKKIAVQ